MKKIITTISCLLLSAGFLMAQQLTVGAASIAKVERPAVIASYNMPAEIVKDALADKLKRSSISKGSKVKGGFRAYRGVNIPEISDDKIDVYTRVTGKKNTSTLSFAVSRGYDNFVSPENDAETMEKMKTYVAGMVNNVNIAKIKTDIASQAKVLNKAEKAESTAVKKGKSLESEMKSLESKLEANKKAQESNTKTQAEAAEKVKAEKAMLEELKSKLEMMLK
jgi:hypothetical protein